MVTENPAETWAGAGREQNREWRVIPRSRRREMLAKFGWPAHDTFDKFKWNQAAIEHQAA
jgi:hypothetical protein